MARKSKTVTTPDPVPQTRDDAVATIARIGALQRDRLTIEVALSETISRAREQAEIEAKPISDQIASLTRGLEAWAAANRAALTNGNRSKTADLGTGTISWRQRPPSVSVRGLDAVIEACRKLGLLRFLREKIEIDKEAMLKEAEVARAIPGVSIGSAGEDFIVEPAAK